MPFCAFEPETILPDLGNQIELSLFKGNLPTIFHLTSYPAAFFNPIQGANTICINGDTKKAARTKILPQWPRWGIHPQKNEGLEVWKMFSFSQGWFSGSILVFQGVTTESTDILLSDFFCGQKKKTQSRGRCLTEQHLTAFLGFFTENNMFCCCCAIFGVVSNLEKTSISSNWKLQLIHARLWLPTFCFPKKKDASCTTPIIVNHTLRILMSFFLGRSFLHQTTNCKPASQHVQRAHPSS